MAYRFLLQVPEAVAEEAQVAVEEVGDAEVVVDRASYAEGFDVPGRDITVAAHSLRVIDSIYNWYDAFEEPRPDCRIVLYSGERVHLEESNRDRMVAAIRRDQPWVERTIPKIGDHVREGFDPAAAARNLGVPVAGVATGNAMSTEVGNALRAEGVAEVERARRVTIPALNYVAIQVADTHKAEEFYREFFDMDVVARTRNTADGVVPCPMDYDWATAIKTEETADDVYLRNGALALGLHRVGLGARIDRSVVDRISLRVDSQTFHALKGWVMMRSFEQMGSTGASFRFRDPYGVPWEILMAGALPFA